MGLPETGQQQVDQEQQLTRNGQSAVINPLSGERAILQARDLCLHYDKFQALYDISMDLPEHRVTAIIGPSGCGKSTFLRCLNRMNDTIPTVKTTGQILFYGHDVNAKSIDPVQVRRSIGMVFQKPNPFPKSIYENIAFGLRINGMTDRLDERVENALRRAAIWEEVKDDLHSKTGYDLSGGQQQRLCIARTLAVEPEVVLMDEPCSALDPIATAKIEDLIEEIKGDYTVIIVTHNMQQAARVSDYTAFFYLGKLIEYGETTRLFEKPDNPETEAYITGKFG